MSMRNTCVQLASAKNKPQAVSLFTVWIQKVLAFRVSCQCAGDHQAMDLESMDSEVLAFTVWIQKSIGFRSLGMKGLGGMQTLRFTGHGFGVYGFRGLGIHSLDSESRTQRSCTEQSWHSQELNHSPCTQSLDSEGLEYTTHGFRVFTLT
eukprot:11212536-Lingulodinium_polyedra.AAC.1